MSVDDRYGLAVCTASLVPTLCLAFLWLQDFFLHGNAFAHRPGARRLILLLPPALLALWRPLDPSTGLPDIHVRYLFESGSALTFCMTTTATLAVLLAHFPSVNRPLLKASALFGFLFGMGNLVLEFVILPELLWTGVMHFPLLILSAAGLFVSFRDPAKKDTEKRNTMNG
ncbi:MAG: hypothetical protein JW929_11410 [Anaerolineales bacterium]|nr:hypothetical protein [Anaerolineales bacterium]